MFTGGKDSFSCSKSAGPSDCARGKASCGRAAWKVAAPMVEANNFLGLTFCGSKDPKVLAAPAAAPAFLKSPISDVISRFIRIASARVAAFC